MLEIFPMPCYMRHRVYSYQKPAPHCSKTKRLHMMLYVPLVENLVRKEHVHV